MYEEDERFVPPSELGSAARSVDGSTIQAMPIRSIVFPQFDVSFESPCDPLLVALTPGEVLERLMQSVLGSGPISSTTFNELARLAASARGHLLRYGRLDQALCALDALI